MAEINRDEENIITKKEESRRRLCLQLFLSFFKIGAFTFGGGYAMIPIIQRETAERHKWITEKDLLDVIAIAESTPGPISINAATFIGYRVAGVAGAFCATLGTVLPSFVIILIISHFLRRFESIKEVRWAFNGIRAGVAGLIINAVVKMAKACPKNTFSYIVAALAFFTVVVFDVSVLLVIACAAVVGIAFAAISRRSAKEDGEGDAK